MRNPHSNNTRRGAGMVEYGLLVGLIGVGAIVAIDSVGGRIDSLLTSTHAQLVNAVGSGESRPSSENNAAPRYVSGSPSQVISVNEDESISSYTLTFNDADGDSLSYSFSGSHPAGITLTNNGDSTATFSGSPTLPGSYTFSVEADDGVSSGQSPDIEIEVFAGLPSGILLGTGDTIVELKSDGTTQEVFNPSIGVTYSAKRDGDRYLAVGNGGVLVTLGANGQWSEGQIDPDYGFTFRDIGKVGDAYFVVGGSGAVYKSSDGNSWADLTISSSPSLKAVASFGSRIIVAGGAYNSPTAWYSDDGGQTFTEASVDIAYNYLGSIASGPDGLVAGRGDDLQFSSDGSSWSEIPMSNYSFIDGDTDMWVNDMIYHANTYIAVGRDNNDTRPNRSMVLTSSDGQTWTEVDAPASNLTNIDSTEEGLIATGVEGTIIRSTDGGTTWQDVPTPSDTNFKWAQ